MIQRPDIRTQAEELVKRTNDDATRSAVLDALGRYNQHRTADNYDALYDAINGDGKQPPKVGSLGAARDARIG